MYEQFFKFVEVGELVLIEEYVADIHLATVLILVAPHTGGSEVFQRKPERIDLVMAPGAIRALSMGRKAFADGELSEIFLVRFIERRHIGRWRFGRVIENHGVDPCAARDRLRA